MFRLKHCLPKVRLLSKYNQSSSTKMGLILKLICFEMMKNFFSANEFEHLFSLFLQRSTMNKVEGIPFVFQEWYSKEPKMQSQPDLVAEKFALRN